MLGLGPIWALMIAPRLVPGWARARFGRTIIATNIALAVLLVGLCTLARLARRGGRPAAHCMLAGAIGIWMFYVQHQFEDVYWSARRIGATPKPRRGSSYLKLPSVLQFFTGNIGLHHVHHLSARIPNYNLQRAHDENPVFQTVPRWNAWTVSWLYSSSSTTRTAAGMVTFRDAHTARAAAASNARAASR